MEVDEPLRTEAIEPQPLQTVPTTSLTADELQWGMFCHLAGALPVPPFIGPSLGAGLCWLLKKDTSPWVDEQGKKALNFHLTNLIFMAAALLLVPFLCIPLLNIVAAAGIALVVGGVKPTESFSAIIAGLTVKDGKPFKYPFSFNLIK